MDLSAYCGLKIFIGNFAISISIEFIKDLFELLITYPAKTPVLEIKPELFWLDGARFLDI